ncbi:MAG: DUF3465 domain-containing protein [Gemmatimonadota bacterium]
MNRRALLRALAVLMASALAWWFGRPSSQPPGADAEVLGAFRDQRSGVMVELDAQVTRLLPDDTIGSPHQRFIVRLAGGHTLLVSHNIELAARVPVAVGDRVRLRGQYEWNPQGGVLHWTHHDPGGEREGGWISLEGTTYR